MQIQIKNLRLRAIIGINDWERDKKQDIVINITFDFDGTKAAHSDQIEDTVDYKALTKRLITEVEGSDFYLLEKLAYFILKIVLDDPRVTGAVVTVEKPHALRFADSVAITCSGRREA